MVRIYAEIPWFKTTYCAMSECCPRFPLPRPEFFYPSYYRGRRCCEECADKDSLPWERGYWIFQQPIPREWPT